MSGNPGPPKPADAAKDEESLDSWGFSDTRFVADPKGVVTLSGNRYELSGKRLEGFMPWMCQVLQVKLDPTDLNVSNYPRPVADPVRCAPFEAEIATFLKTDQVVLGNDARIRHSHGHNLEEMFSIKYGDPGRVPDLVVSPDNEDQVIRIMDAAVRHSVCLIPYGGGTNVSGALRCSPEEKRQIVSVDMRRMNRILSVDKVNRTAHIESGAAGREIGEALRKQGFTIGHEPDSFEFSTLGGWIATHASGMKKNKYGNIENLLLDMRVVTPAGLLHRTASSPRESIGADPRRWIIGSEGNFGIVTSAVIKLFPLPEVQHYGSIVFPSFEKGVAFMYELAQLSHPPASVRLVDNLQFQFSQALKTPSVGLKKVKSKVERFVVEKIKHYDVTKISACTLLFEGTAHEVAEQEREVYRIGARFGGMKGGSENGRRGYQMTFSIAYIRDFAMDHYILSESFETSVPWSRLIELCDNVKKRVWDEHRKRKLPGIPFVSCRVTQLYETGACIYFYFGFYYKGIPDPAEAYVAIENAAREEILKAGGSLSHHHGVGKLRQHFLPDVMSEASIDWIRRSKQAIDPKNIMGARNQALGDLTADKNHG